MVKVAIAGTGPLAQHIACAAKSLGHEVLLLSRNEHPELRPRLRVVKVEYTSPCSADDNQSALVRALDGVDTVISTIPHTAPQLALIDACLVARVEKFAPSEFERVPGLRPIVCTAPATGGASGGGSSCDGDKLAVLARLHDEKHRLDSTVFICGLFMDRFGRERGKGSHRGREEEEGDAEESGQRRRGREEALLDIDAGKAWIPTGGEGGGTAGGTNARACFIAMENAGMFVAKALTLEDWPEKLRCCGERLEMAGVVAIAQEVIGKEFDVRKSDWNELQDLAADAAENGDADGEARIDLLLAIQQGEFDFTEPELNGLFPEVKTMTFKEWLKREVEEKEEKERGGGEKEEGGE